MGRPQTQRTLALMRAVTASTSPSTIACTVRRGNYLGLTSPIHRPTQRTTSRGVRPDFAQARTSALCRISARIAGAWPAMLQQMQRMRRWPKPFSFLFISGPVTPARAFECSTVQRRSANDISLAHIGLPPNRRMRELTRACRITYM